MPTFPRSYPHSFPGAFAPLVGYEALEGTSLAWVESHCDEGKALLISQFSGKPRLEAFLCALLDGIAGEGGVQELENASWQCLTERWLDTSEGVQLDVIGRIVDLPRAGWSDGTYALLLGAQILVLSSQGTWPDALEILEALGVSTSLARIVEPGMAAMRIELGAPLEGDIGPADCFRLVTKAKPAGVRFTLVYPTVDVDHSFTLADNDEAQVDADRGLGCAQLPVALIANVTPGDLEIRPLSLATFPAVGPYFVRLRNGVGDTELVEASGTSLVPYDRIVLSEAVVGAYAAGPGAYVARVGLGGDIGGYLAGLLATTEAA